MIKLMQARYPGKCRDCRKATKRGERIGVEGGWRVWCEECAGLRIALEGAKRVRAAGGLNLLAAREG